MNDNTTSFFSQIRNPKGDNHTQNLCMGCMQRYDSEFDVCPYCGYVVNTEPEEPIFLSPGSVLADRYYIGKALGNGSFGVTYIGWDAKLEQKVAIKEYLPSEFSTRMPGKTRITVLGGNKTEQYMDGMRKFIDEAKRLAKFQNEPGIVKVFDSFEENQSAYIVMEMLEGKTLTDYLKENGPVPEETAVEILRPVMESLQVVHEEGIIHRDISPDNIFICDTGEVKLIDFGAARYATTSHTRTITTIIKPGYSPEEQYRSSNDQGPHTDVYALGATLYKMITGKTPPDGLERRTRYETKGEDLLVSPAKYQKNLTRVREVAILNAMNIQITDRTPDVGTLMKELDADTPARRINGKIKKLPTYRWPTWAKVAVPVVSAAVVLFLILLLTDVIRFSKNTNEEIKVPDRYVAMPNIEGLTEAEAVLKIKESGLKPQLGESVTSEYCASGIVIYQEYLAGAYIEIGAVISYKVSIGNGEVETDGDYVIIPYLKGTLYETAEKKLKDSGLLVEYEEVYYDSDPGLIITSDPQENTKVKIGSTVKLQVSKGPEPFKLELDLAGMQEEKAVKELLAIELAYPEITYVENDAEKGTVLSQSVAVGDKVTKGQKLKLTVSGGASEKLIEVPDVYGLSEAKAKAALEDKGFGVEVSREYSTSVAKGNATRTSPVAGSQRYAGETVILYISNGVKEEETTAAQTTQTTEKATEETKIKIPSVSSKKLEEAKKLLASFTVSVSEVYSSDVASGYAIKTDPAEGSSVKKGSAVTLYVSKGPEKHTITFSANGGTVSESTRTVSVGDQYGTLPTATREYYTFDGWYTAKSGGTKAKASDVMGQKDITLYAVWVENGPSDWVLASDVPADASIQATKWTYTYTEHTSSNSSTLSGWTYKDMSTEYGSWGSWTTDAITASDTTDVETQVVQIHTGYNLREWNYSISSGRRYMDYDPGNPGAYVWFRDDLWISVNDIGNYEYVSPGSWSSYGSYPGKNIGNSGGYNNGDGLIYFIYSNTYADQTQYRSRTVTRTYYFERTTEKESSTEVVEGGDISNVKKWVRYKSK